MRLRRRTAPRRRNRPDPATKLASYPEIDLDRLWGSYDANAGPHANPSTRFYY
jgi:hypothetical protein